MRLPSDLGRVRLDLANAQETDWVTVSKGDTGLSPGNERCGAPILRWCSKARPTAPES